MFDETRQDKMKQAKHIPTLTPFWWGKKSAHGKVGQSDSSETQKFNYS